MKEKWRDIAGYLGYYQISNMGRVRSMRREIEYKNGRVHKMPELILKPVLVQGYFRVVFYKCGTRKNFRVNRLVAAAFVRNPHNLAEADHINEIKTDNRAENLQWLSNQANTERSRAKHYKFISPAGELVEIYNLRKFCRKNNMNHSHMCGVHLGRYRVIKGWKAANQIQFKERCA